MTEEEIKNLKIGDKFTIEFTVTSNLKGHVLSAKVGDATYLPEYGSIGLKHATLIKPTPTFEVGDTVRIIPDPLTGTIHKGTLSKPDVDEGHEYKIIGEMDAAGDCKVERNFRSAWVSVHCLELVKKAVKDKYKVQADPCTWDVVEGACIVASYDRGNHPNAEAAAKAECDRLNTEWRKQQEGGES